LLNKNKKEKGLPLAAALRTVLALAHILVHLLAFLCPLDSEAVFRVGYYPNLFPITYYFAVFMFHLIYLRISGIR